MADRGAVYWLALLLYVALLATFVLGLEYPRWGVVALICWGGLYLVIRAARYLRTGRF